MSNATHTTKETAMDKLTAAQADALNRLIVEVTCRIKRSTRDALERRGYVLVLLDGVCRITDVGRRALEQE
jgi:hypothetical protein